MDPIFNPDSNRNLVSLKNISILTRIPYLSHGLGVISERQNPLPVLYFLLPFFPFLSSSVEMHSQIDGWNCGIMQSKTWIRIQMVMNLMDSFKFRNYKTRSGSQKGDLKHKQRIGSPKW